MLPPTSPRIYDRDAIPYFLWDLRMTVGQMRATLATGTQTDRDEVLVRLLREANSRDVWVFVGWSDVLEAWPRIVHRLGRARPVWQMMVDRHREHVADAPAR